MPNVDCLSFSCVWLDLMWLLMIDVVWYAERRYSGGGLAGWLVSITSRQALGSAVIVLSPNELKQ